MAATPTDNLMSEYKTHLEYIAQLYTIMAEDYSSRLNSQERKYNSADLVKSVNSDLCNVCKELGVILLNLDHPTKSQSDSGRTFFFQISKHAFLEANPIMDNTTKTHGLRLDILNEDGLEQFMFLPAVTIPELLQITSILRLPEKAQFRHFDDVRRYWQQISPKYRERSNRGIQIVV